MGGGRRALSRKEKINGFDTGRNVERKVEFPEADYYDDEDEEFNFKKLFIIIAVIAIIIMIVVLLNKFVFNKKVEEKTPEPAQTSASNNMTSMKVNIEGYRVLGKIKIPSLNVEQHILDSTEEKALKNGVGRIDNNGGSINGNGNFCLAGHNEDDIFGKLNELEVGNEFILINKKLEETTYKITKIYEVEPDDLQCLLQDENKVEVTLITCQNGATTRLVVKAEKVENTSTTNTTTNTSNT